MQGFKRFCVKLNPSIFKKKKKKAKRHLCGRSWVRTSQHPKKRSRSGYPSRKRTSNTSRWGSLNMYPSKNKWDFYSSAPQSFICRVSLIYFIIIIFWQYEFYGYLLQNHNMFISRLRRRLTCWGDRGSIWSWSVGGSNAGSSSPDTMWSRTWPERCEEKPIPSSTQSHFRSQFYDTYLSFCLFV